MKRLFTLFVLMTIVAVLITSCDSCKQPPKGPFFAGVVVDGEGQPVAGTEVEAGGKTTATDERGNFKIAVDASERYVLNIFKEGYRFVSKIYGDTSSTIRVQLAKATVVTVQAGGSNEIVVQDVNRSSMTPLSAQITSVKSPLDTIPFVYDEKGRLVDFVAPKEIKETYTAIEQFQPPLLGASISLPGDALVDPENPERSVEGDVLASISTVDLYAPDGMPGDYTLRFPDGSRGFMRTYGAADVSFFKDKKRLQLKKGQYATLTIPVDTLSIISKEQLPETIPLLVYEEKTGEWVRDGKNEGVLNEKRDAYVAKITHFSVFNMDMEFANPACYKLCAAGVPSTALAEISVVSKTKAGLPFGSSLCAGLGDCGAGEAAFSIIYLQANTPVGLRLFDPGTNQIRSSYVFIAGGPSVPHDINCSGNYASCSGPTSISWTPPPYMNPNGTMNKPIIALRLEGTNLKISWVYIAGSPPTYTNPATNYTIEWTISNFPIVEGSVTVTGSTKWHDSILVPLASLPDVGTNYRFRIRVGVAGPTSDSSVDCFIPAPPSVGPC
jgi:hypothetical protein